MKRTSLILVFAFSFYGLSACTLMQRHPNSGYSGSYEYEPETEFDSSSTRALSPEEQQEIEDRIVLMQLEKNIRTMDERSQYQRFRATLESDRERIEFLKLDDISARERYLQSRGYSSAPRRYEREVASLIESNDIALGMTRQAVVESWGEPEERNIAGRRDSGNEQWIYIEQIPTSEGWQEEQRVLYFENGRLVGWQKN